MKDMKWCRMYEGVKIVMNSSTHVYKLTNVGQHHCGIQVLRNTKHTSELNTTCKVNDNIKRERGPTQAIVDRSLQMLSSDGNMLVD